MQWKTIEKEGAKSIILMNVIKYDFWDPEDKEGLEEIYKDTPNVEIVWSK